MKSKLLPGYRAQPLLPPLLHCTRRCFIAPAAAALPCRCCCTALPLLHCPAATTLLSCYYTARHCFIAPAAASLLPLLLHCPAAATLPSCYSRRCFIATAAPPSLLLLLLPPTLAPLTLSRIYGIFGKPHTSSSSCLASCCASCACQACKGCICIFSRRSARLAYCALFALSLVLAWTIRDLASPILAKIPWVNRFSYSPGKNWFAVQAVLRVSFGNFVFFMGLALIMIGVKYKDDCRDALHHGSWMAKLVVWSALIVLSLFVPNEVIEAYGGLSKFGSGLFLVIQVVMLLDFTYNLNLALILKDEKFWYSALLIVTIFFYIVTFSLSGFLYYRFNVAYQDCALNLFLITSSLSLGISFAVISLHPQVNGSLLCASVIALYCMYLCYSALSSEPRDYECNGIGRRRAEVVSTGMLFMGTATTLLSVIYSAVRAGSSTSLLAPESSLEEELPAQPLLNRNLEAAASGTRFEDGDYDFDHDSKKHRAVTYNYSFFHVVFSVASMYSGMLLTSWDSSAGKDAIDIGWSSVWVRAATMWLTAALYIWSLIAPIILPELDFT